MPTNLEFERRHRMAKLGGSYRCSCGAHVNESFEREVASQPKRKPVTLASIAGEYRKAGGL